MTDASPSKPPQGTLLVVDDETGPRESLRIVFRDQYNVVTAPCGREGVKAALDNPVDVVILDVRMPDMTGTDVLREIKLIDPRIEVIMLTGYETIDSARAAVRYGAADYVNKPFDVFKMRETVARCFERRRLAIEAESSLHQLQILNKELEAEIFEKERKLSAGELSSGVVHELNNPLAIISARAELLNRELQKIGALENVSIDMVRVQLELIQKEVFRCRRISQRFLNFSRASSTEIEATEIASVVEDAIALVEAHPSCRNTEIKYQPIQEKICIRANSVDLLQLFINLGINAVQAMNGEGTLTVTIEQRASAAEWLNTPLLPGQCENLFRSPQMNSTVPAVLISFCDTGPGIGPDVMQRIFEPYFTTKQKGHGTGLGLAICTRFIEKYMGALRIISKVGEGTTATVVLPTDT